jgi:molybdopterin synthase sulfur carrier subunit
MAVVHIPAAMRSLTGGRTQVTVPGASVGEVIDALEAEFPGLKARLTADGRLRGNVAVFVDDQLPNGGLRAKVGPDSVIYFAPAIAGGRAPAGPNLQRL